MSDLAVLVRLNGELAQRAGCARVTITLPRDSTIEEVFTNIGRANPSLDTLLNQAVPVVNGQHVSRVQKLSNGDEVAILMPIAGG